MGKMIMNGEEFLPMPLDTVNTAIEQAGNIAGNITDAVKEYKIKKLETEKDKDCLDAQIVEKNYSVKYDTVSNIVGDVCHVITSITSALSNRRTEIERTRRVVEQEQTKRRLAKEETERFIKAEDSKTERFRIACQLDIAKAEKDLEKVNAQLNVVKESIMKDHTEYMASLDTIRTIINSIINANNTAMKAGCDISVIMKNNDKLVSLAEQIVALYGHSANNKKPETNKQ